MADLERNKSIVRRFVEEFQSGRNEAAADELLASELMIHHGQAWSETSPVDREEAKRRFAATFHAAFPDLHVVIHDQIAEGDKIVTRKTFFGTHRGQFMGVLPTGKDVTIDMIDIVRIENAQMVEHWNVIDLMGLMQQLGAIPPSPPRSVGDVETR